MESNVLDLPLGLRAPDLGECWTARTEDVMLTLGAFCLLALLLLTTGVTSSSSSLSSSEPLVTALTCTLGLSNMALFSLLFLGARSCNDE